MISKRGEDKVLNERIRNAGGSMGAECFRNFIFGKKFTAVTDHKVLVTLINGNNKKKKQSSVDLPGRSIVSFRSISSSNTRRGQKSNR